MVTLTQPIKYHGGKHYLAKRIISLFPRHLHYVEPFFGGGAVLLARDPEDEALWFPPHKGVSEVANDINGELTNFWRVLRGSLFPDFQRIVETIPLSRTEYQEFVDNIDEDSDDALSAAVSFFVRCRQSRAGMMKDFTSITRSRVRRGMNGNVSEWLGAVDGLADVHARLRRVLIENMDAIDLIRREDTEGTLFYCDPPYLPSTRATPNLYAHEMTTEAHVELLETLKACKGKVILSGYPSDLYDSTLDDWRVVDFELPNNAAGGESKRRMTERLWLNFPEGG